MPTDGPRVLHPTDSAHPVLDVRSLDACFGADDLRACGEPRASANGPGVVSSPFDVWLLHRLREQAGLPTFHALPTDLFVWSIEAPRDLATTRLGGMPYLPAAAPWPRRDGVPGTFCAQLCFADSRDLVPPLPADVLLVFRFDGEAFDPWRRDSYAFVWVARDARQPVWDQCDAPPLGVDDGARLFGVRVRTFDDPTLVERIRRDGLPAVHVCDATKVGGAPSDRQSIDPPETPPDWRFLGQVAGTWPPNCVPYPVLGHRAPVDYGTEPFYRLMHGPGDGILCLYLDGGGEVQIAYNCS